MAEKYAFPANYAEKILQSFLDAVEDGLFQDGYIRLPGIGQLKVRECAGRTGRNPGTGASLDIPASKRIIFKPSARIKDDLK